MEKSIVWRALHDFLAITAARQPKQQLGILPVFETQQKIIEAPCPASPIAARYGYSPWDFLTAARVRSFSPG